MNNPGRQVFCLKELFASDGPTPNICLGAMQWLKFEAVVRLSKENFILCIFLYLLLCNWTSLQIVTTGLLGLQQNLLCSGYLSFAKIFAFTAVGRSIPCAAFSRSQLFAKVRTRASICRFGASSLGQNMVCPRRPSLNLLSHC